MKLSSKQQIFTSNIGRLIEYAGGLGIGLTFGHAWRSPEEQDRLIKEGLSWTKSSKHLVRLAVDFNFFIDGDLTYKKEDIQPMGDYWEDLHEGNSWGGNWSKKRRDTPHFQMS